MFKSDSSLDNTAYPRMEEVSKGRRSSREKGGGLSFFCLCARLLTWIQVLVFPLLMPVFIVWVKQISWVRECNSFSLCFSARCNLLLVLFLCCRSSSLLFFLCLHRSPRLFYHRHLQPVSAPSTEGKPEWGKPPCRGASTWPPCHSNPNKPWIPKNSTAPSS